MNMKRMAAILSAGVTLSGALFGAFTMHQSMNEVYEAPTFASKVVTVQPELMAAANQWKIEGIEFVPVKSNPQIHFTSGVPQGAMVGAEATRYMDDDNHIVTCGIKVGERVTFPMLTHEFGHCMGLSHEVHTEGTNMYQGHQFYQQGWSDKVTEFDLDNLRTLYAG